MNGEGLATAMDYKQMLISAGYLLAIVAAAYFLTKFVGGRARMVRGGASQLKIIERLAFSRDKSVMLVKAGTKYLVLGVSNNQVTLITELREDELTPVPEEKVTDFSTVFKAMRKGAEWRRDEGGEGG